jgi:hypothetical protein
LRRADWTKGPPFWKRKEKVRQGSRMEKIHTNRSSMPSCSASSLALSSFRIAEERYWNGRSYFLAMAMAWSFTRSEFSNKNGLRLLPFTSKPSRNWAIAQPDMIGR